MIKFFRKIRHQLLTENKPASPAGLMRNPLGTMEYTTFEFDL